MTVWKTLGYKQRILTKNTGQPIAGMNVKLHVEREGIINKVRWCKFQIAVLWWNSQHKILRYSQKDKHNVENVSISCGENFIIGLIPGHCARRGGGRHGHLLWGPQHGGTHYPCCHIGTELQSEIDLLLYVKLRKGNKSWHPLYIMLLFYSRMK